LLLSARRALRVDAWRLSSLAWTSVQAALLKPPGTKISVAIIA
jgi:hypothetical protein